MSVRDRRYPGRLIFWLSLAIATAGCGNEPGMDNACPRIVGTGSVEWIGDDLRMGIWIQDLEEDPVDLLVTTSEGEEVEDIGGHGVVGLTSSADLPGTPHELLVPGDQVASGDELTLVPSDLESCKGPEVKVTVP